MWTIYNTQEWMRSGRERGSEKISPEEWKGRNWQRRQRSGQRRRKAEKCCFIDAHGGKYFKKVRVVRCGSETR